ncbi:MAG: hypothetical protein ACLFUS_15780 [Candidatus Sumerlaeia bacterium]
MKRLFGIVMFLAIALAAVCPGLGFAQDAATNASDDWKPGPILSRMLEGPMADVEEIVVAERARGLDGHWYANFAYPLLFPHVSVASPGGGRLVAFNIRTGERRILLEDLKGAVRDPIVNYDATRILFSYRPGNSPYYKLYEINVDGTNLRQITHGESVDDIEPCYLPDGDIMFISSRCYRWVPCWYTQVGTTYRCDPDGGNIRQISFGVEHENTPWVLPDGRVLYTRWEYVDRHTNRFHHLWTFNPDGTGQMVYYGNIGGSHVMIDAKPIPGTEKVVSIFSPFHGRNEHQGDIIVLDVSNGPSDIRPPYEPGYPHLNPGAETMINKYKEEGTYRQWRDPWAFSEDCFMAANPQGIAVLDELGNWELIYPAPEGKLSDVDGHGKRMEFGVWAHEPRPIVPRRREPDVVSRVDYSQTEGTMVLQDVMISRNLDGVKPGEIKSLLVLEEMPRPVSPIWSYGDLGYFGTFRRSDTGLTGSLIIHRVLGTVPVEEDGSAFFRAPAQRPLFFVALDKDGNSIKRMQSFVSLMPGESVSCIGCHEDRTITPPPMRKSLRALQRKPSVIRQVKGVPESGIIDFPRDIQPILDRHCVKCHDEEKRKGGMILTGTRAARTTMAYGTMVMHELTGINGLDYKRNDMGNTGPRSMGSAVSPLIKLLSKGHHKVQLSDEEFNLIRAWVDSSALFSGTYAKLAFPQPPTAEKGFAPVSDIVKKRCGECHINSKRGASMGWPNDDYWDALFNRDEPEKSPLLLAPLAREAGGWGACRQSKARSWDPAAGKREKAELATIFETKDDPDYQAIQKYLMDELGDFAKRPDYYEEGFVPAPFYVREMKRYGVLDPEWNHWKEPIDFFALEEDYYNLFYPKGK